MKTLKPLALICALTLLLSGCRYLSWQSADPPPENYNDPTKYIEEFQDNLQYRQLNGVEKHGYGQIYTAIRDSEKENSFITDTTGNRLPGVRIPLSNIRFTSEQMSHLFEVFFRDNPRFFYLDRTFSLEGYDQGNQTVYNTFLLQFTMDTEQRLRAIGELDRTMAAIFAACPRSNDDYEVELYLHNHLLSSCVYDVEAASASSNEYANAYSAYGALVEGKAVCEGYAKAMQLLLTSASIPATVILGNAVEDNEPHMWNVVTINGHDYYLDPTWNDDDGYIQYTYFNVTTEMLLRTHIPEEGSYTVDCTTVTDNYHYRNGTYIDTYERDVIAEVVANRIAAGDTVISLRFAEGKFENALLFFKNASLTQRTVNKYLQNGKMWDYEFRTQARQGTILIFKK